MPSICRIFFIPLFILCFIFPSISETFYGKIKIIDGDTIKINNLSVRLHGIDAPEKNQKCILESGKEWNCGIESTKALKQFIVKTKVYCKGTQYDRYRRLIGNCYSDDRNIQSFMVRNGWAIAYRRYSKDYIEEEQEARRDKLGIWQGTFQFPEEWRRSKK